MTHLNYKNIKGRSKETGATLIVVLIILLIVISVGVLAIRVAIVSLKVATNSQVGQLNFQSSDTPLELIVQMNPTTLTNITNVIGAALKAHESNPGAEYNFCYKPTSTSVSFAQTRGASLLRAGSANNAVVEDGGVAGFCDLTSDYGSNRQAVVTQVAVSIPTDAMADIPGSNLPRDINLSEGTQLPKSMLSTQRIRVITTAFLPAYASNSLETLQSDCLSTSSAKISDNFDSALTDKQTLADCLANHNVPFSTQVQEFNYTNKLTEITAPGS
ncbi:pilus assembly protein [Acinetobacter baumannii]|uniref:PilX N-terminal domain-containing pilus assembly protein n=1 Tax=Acinetobacter baumannii TaxID=470 RepID=UPI0002B9A2FE|nr:PilX N-terminal domain-containing pilus assembly protein [Acinetobacter baumannii]EHZ6828257.1 pilus assembly protein [Acinetobacter baumannii]EHZ7899353.1 pilus assembly protein [Acinetobacter baumannii]EIO2225513.1 pilus assembly protein [Acinetobacter baumannii]EJD6088066.1 pilus assembly protein [Acinetobacter baumannii]EJN6994280.1 pilus assembly protein [Acinetobacter baumannii]